MSSASSSRNEPPQAFTRTDLDRIASKLAKPPPYTPDFIPPHTVTFQKRPASEAAVLIPLVNVQGQAHVLFEVRSGNLRTHGGEVRSVKCRRISLTVRRTADARSFPGGRMDKVCGLTKERSVRRR